MKPLPAPRAALWALLAAPAAVIAWRYATDSMSYGEVVHATGEWSVWLLIVTLAATPARMIFPRARWAIWLVRERRGLGVAVFGYALFHLCVYAWRKADLALIMNEAKDPGLLTGWIAFALFVALALTSNDLAVSRLGRNWKRLHRLVYAGAALTLIHWLLTAFSPTQALFHAGVLAVIVALRLAMGRRGRGK